MGTHALARQRATLRNCATTLGGGSNSCRAIPYGTRIARRCPRAALCARPQRFLGPLVQAEEQQSCSRCQTPSGRCSIPARETDWDRTVT